MENGANLALAHERRRRRDGRAGGLIQRLIVEPDATDGARATIVAALATVAIGVMVVVEATESANCRQTSVNLQRRGHEMDRAAGPAAACTLLVVWVVAAASRAAAALQASGQLCVTVGRAASGGHA